MSIKENITLPLLEKVASHGVLNVKKEQKVSKEYFDNMNIKAPDMETMVQQLSGGNQQKVVLAKWMARNPQILILDEPTRGIDIGAKYEIYKIMMDLVKRGVSIIMISSELPELISMADRIMVIQMKIRGILNAKEYSQEKSCIFQRCLEKIHRMLVIEDGKITENKKETGSIISYK